MEKNDSKCEVLYEYLVNQYNDLFHFKLENFTLHSKMIVITKNDKEVYIEISKNDDIFLYGDSENNDLIQNIVPIINVYKNGKSPSFEYNTYDIEQDIIIDNTVEWSSNQEERFNDLKYGRTNRYPYVIRNLSVLFESKEEKDRRLGFTDFVGCYFPNNSLDNFDKFISMVDKYNEQDCFLVLKTLGLVISYGVNKDWKGYLPDSVVVGDAIDVVLNKISMLLDNDSDNVKAFLGTEQYIDWYNKWNEYFTYEKKCEYMEAKLNNEDVSMFVPENTQTLKKKTNKNI